MELVPPPIASPTADPGGHDLGGAPPSLFVGNVSDNETFNETGDERVDRRAALRRNQVGLRDQIRVETDR